MRSQMELKPYGSSSCSGDNLAVQIILCSGHVIAAALLTHRQ
jgi:hypothetical protein